MDADRRGALALIGGGAVLAAAPGWATSLSLPPLELTASQLTQGGWARGIARGGLTLDLDGAAIPTAPDGTFLIAFDRDARPAATLSGKAANGWAASRGLTIAPRAWQIERIDTPLRPPGVPDTAF